MVLQWVNKVIFSNTEINSDFFIQLLNRGSRLNYIKMENCTLMNGCNKSADISVCKSLNRLEIIDCSYTANLLDTHENIFSIHSYKNNNIEKLTILRNTDILIKKDILEKSTNLLEVNISITNEENVYEEEVHLENLQILHIDYTSELVPKLTVGNKIEEIVLNGFPDNFIKLSSIMRDNKESVGFPKFRVFHLKTPDQMTSCRNIIVDVILDVFSNDTKFIVDKDIKSIKEYYLEYRNPHFQFFNSIEGLIDNAILIKLSNLFLEISNIGNQSIVEEFLEEVSTKIQTFKLIGQDIEQEAVSNSNKNNEYDPGTKSVTNKYTRIDSLLYEYATGNKSVIEEFYKTLKQENKAAIVLEVYREITNEIDHIKLNTEEDVLELKRKFLTQARDKVIKDFSEAWFVSKDELDLSAIQYVAGANSIPNISGIINSKDYDSYKTKNLDANPIKYAQAMKQDWQKELDEKIVWLNDELRRVEK
ncbi:hypothetical protein R3M60_16790 [Bacillus subtilis]|uniref:hypothetical protein n=1 Tax=Bacillus subtilis TaxID=1423 RepID=UPI0029E7F7C1|nr:hypothetical protein [Bacillus subtilis]MDX7996917.1 hypothetical protein [Bacillus subtilis]